MKSKLENIAKTAAAGVIALGMALPVTADETITPKKSVFGNAKLLPIEKIVPAEESASKLVAEYTNPVEETTPAKAIPDLQATIEEKATPEIQPIVEEEREASRWLIENWFGATHYTPEGTPWVLNKGITIFTDDFQLGYDLLSDDRNDFFGPFVRGRVVVEPEKHLPWFNIWEASIGLKYKKPHWQINAELVYFDYLSQADFDNIGDRGWDLLPDEREGTTYFRANASFWDDWKKGKLLGGEEWAAITYFGEGYPGVASDNVVGMTNVRLDLNLLRFDEEWGHKQGVLGLFADAHGAYDTKQLPWNNIYEGTLGAQLKWRGLRVNAGYVWGDFHGNAQHTNIGGRGWDTLPEERLPYDGWRFGISFWKSFHRDR